MRHIKDPRKKVHVYRIQPDNVRRVVYRACEDSKLTKVFDPEKLTLIKINLSSETHSPGTNTSPWILDAVLWTLQKLGFRNIKAIECDASHGLKWGDKALEGTKFDLILRKYNVEFILTDNLPRDENTLPILLKRSQLISLPIIHTHDLAVISCAAKNLFGLLPVNRHKYHKKLPQKLLELSQLVRGFHIVDGSIGLHGASPRIGDPIRMDLLLAGYDPIALDLVVSKIVDLGLQEFPQLKLAITQHLIQENEVEIKGDFNNINSLPLYNFHLNKSVSKVHRFLFWLENYDNIKRLIWFPIKYKKYPTGLKNDICIMTYILRTYMALNYKLRKRRILNVDWNAYLNPFEKEYGSEITHFYLD